MTHRLATALVVASLTCGGAATAKVFEPTSFTLKNGLRVVVVENHLAPVVTQMVWYKCGAADEAPGKSGIAHFLEHLMFKGTKTVPAGELSKIVGRNGGTDNAFTSWDYTGYYQTIAADRLELVMKLESDRMSNLVLTDPVVLPERDVIVEERRQRIENNPQAQLTEAMNASLFANHHYGIPIIGWRHEMVQLTRQDAIDWYKKWYRPANAVLVIAGDVKADAVRTLAEKYYGNIPAGQPQLRNTRPQEPELPGERRVVLRDVQVRQPSLVRELLAPSYASEGKEHAYALQVLADLLGGGSTSRLYRSLVVEQKLATAVSADYTPESLDRFAFALSAQPAPGVAIDKLEAALDAEIAKLLKDGATADEISDSKKRLVDSAILARDGVTGGAYAFGLALTTGQTVEDVEAWPDRIAQVEKPMVDAAAKLVLQKNSGVTGWLLPPEGLTAVSDAAPVVPAHAATDPQRVVSPGGIEAWLIEDHKVPVLSLRWSFVGGWALDPAGKEGLVELACTLMDEGAGDLDSQTFQKKLADANINFGIGAERDRLAGNLKTLTKSRDLAVELASLAMTKPRFDEDAVERMRAATLTNIQAEMANPSWLAGRSLAQAIYGDHPYGHPPRGTLASVKTITAADMKSFVQQRMARDTLLVAAAGDIDAATLGPLLDKLFGGLPATSPKAEIADVQLPAQGKTIVVERPIPQTIVVSATQGIKRSDPQWYAASLMNYVLGGGSFNSRLMEEIRDKRGLTYGVSSGLASYEHAASLQASGATKNQTAQQFVDLLKEEFKKMADKGVTQRELDEAKAYQTGSLPLSMTSTDKLASLLLQLRQDNLGIDYLKKRNEMINAVTLADVNAMAKKLLDPAKFTIVMVGKPEGAKTSN